MEEVSIILKDNTVSTVEEFSVLDKYAQIGKILFVIERRNTETKIRQRRVEYIFDPEALMLFYILSTNVLAKWNTADTKNLTIGEEYKLNDVLYISPYYPRSIDIVKF